VHAVDDINLSMLPGQTLGLVGESGCGKSTLGRTILRLYEPTSGSIRFDGEDLLALSPAALRAKRRDMQIIFQDPYASLDPRMTVGQILEQPFNIHNILKPSERSPRVKELLELVGLKASHINRYPHEFSGGQRQRISIARAVALNPRLVIADEPVSALDVSIQAQVLNLMKDLQEKLKLTYIFISHDLSVIEHLCDRIAVMYLGKIVEVATREELFSNPQHPYTKALIGAIPKVGAGKKMMKQSLSGEVPSPLNPPSGCAFHTRCPHKMDVCDKKIPDLKNHNTNTSEHKTACWLFEKETSS
jgi:oligopeptide transport system ATP-binding protein